MYAFWALYNFLGFGIGVDIPVPHWFGIVHVFFITATIEKSSFTEIRHQDK